MNTATVTVQTRAEILAERRDEKRAEARAFAAAYFKLDPAEVLDYHSGICYDKIWVTTRAAAEKVAHTVRGETVNGGWFHGMTLGGITECKDGTLQVKHFEVMC